MNLREKLLSGTDLVGTFVMIPHPMAVEICGTMGFDFLGVEGEHSALDRTDFASLVRAGEFSGCPVLFRVPCVEGGWIASALDAGAAGVIVPRVEDAEEARKVVEAARFHPLGKRGVGPYRAAGYGARMAEYIDTANQSILVVVMIETQRGLENAESIAAIEGIDAVLIGPGDLAASLGGPIALEHAISEIRSACVRQGRATGIFHMGPETVSAADACNDRLHIIGADMAFMLDSGKRVAVQSMQSLGAERRNEATACRTV